jgi:ketosteroid isomerase-like protein
MSQENVEIVRRIYDVVNVAGLGAVDDFFHPEVEVVPPPIWPEGSTLRGRDRVREFARQWRETFEDFKVEPERYLDSGGEGVVVYVRDRGRIKGSPTEIDNRLIHVWTLTDGKVIRWQLFTDEDQALEAAGLRE